MNYKATLSWFLGKAILWKKSFNRNIEFKIRYSELVTKQPLRMEKVILREAMKNDCKEIRRLIQELADFEKMPDGPKIDVKVLEEDGFGSSHPSFGCLVIEDKNEGKLFAYAIYFIAYSTWQGKSMYLEDIYVSPDYRSKGYGSKLFDAIVKKGLELGCKRTDFRVLDWNPAIEFYERKGAIDLTKKDGWHNFGLNLAAMEKLVSKVDELKTS